jgi:hypothetical protein
MQRFTVILFLSVLAAISFFAGVANTKPKHREIAARLTHGATGTLDQPGTINGAQHPEQIPDHVAYLAMFRMLSNRHTAAEQTAVKAYLRQMVGLGRQRNCQDCPSSTGNGDEDIDNFLAAAEEFYQRVSVLDREAAQIKNANWPNPGPAVMNQLAQLQVEKEAITKEIASSLRFRLSATGYERVSRHINEHVKLHTKLVPSPTVPPGEWLQHNDHM